MYALITFFVVIGYLSRKYLTLSHGLLKPLPHTKMYCVIHHYLPRPSFTYSHQYIFIKLSPNCVKSIIVKLWCINYIMDVLTIWVVTHNSEYNFSCTTFGQ